MCEKVKYSLHFDYPDKGRGQISGPINYSSYGAEMFFEKVQDLLDRTLGDGNYRIQRIIMQPWHKNFIATVHLTHDFISMRLPIDMRVRDFCKRAVERFKEMVGNTD